MSKAQPQPCNSMKEEELQHFLFQVSGLYLTLISYYGKLLLFNNVACWKGIIYCLCCGSTCRPRRGLCPVLLAHCSPEPCPDPANIPCLSPRVSAVLLASSETTVWFALPACCSSAPDCLLQILAWQGRQVREGSIFPCTEFVPDSLSQQQRTKAFFFYV